MIAHLESKKKKYEFVVGIICATIIIGNQAQTFFILNILYIITGDNAT